MKKSTERPTDDEITDTVDRYGEHIYRLCFTMLCNHIDAEDAVADTLLRYMTKAPVFREEAHKKAWLLRTATNICKDHLRFMSYRKYVPLEEVAEICSASPEAEHLEELLLLPDKYKVVLYLFYYEGYSTEEIASMLEIRGTAVRKRLQKGRKLLKIELEQGGVI